MIRVANQAEILKYSDGSDGANIAAGFSPAPYTTNLFASWNSVDAYDAADGGGSQIVSSATIYSLKDMSGNGRHLNQATAGSRLTWTANQINGYPAAVAGATQKWMNRTGLNNGFPFTLIGVFKVVAHADSTELFSMTATSANNYMLECINPSPRLQLRTSGVAGMPFSDSMTVGSYHLIFACWNGASSVLRIDNNADCTGTTGSGESLGSIQLGYDGSYTTNRDFAEGWLYQAALASSSGGGLQQRQYFDWKYFNGSLGC